jgi:acid phosphatase (class A)
MRFALMSFSLLAAASVLSGCAATSTATAPASAMAGKPDTGIRAGRVPGYLAAEDIPDSSVLSPPPPAPGSAAQAHDDEVSRKYLAMQGSPRWDLATRDAVLTFPQAALTFSCVLNAPITPDATPTLYSMLQKTLTDAARSTAPAKGVYKRQRPFMVNGKPLCTPEAEDILRKDGSYPSGHSAAGATWSLILAEISPAQSQAILARGRAFAQSRLACNVHWYSDIVEGQVMGAATVAKLHSNSVFQSDLAKARKELEAVRAKGSPVGRDCAAETAILQGQ